MAQTNINNPYKKLTLMLYRCGFNKRNIPRLLTKKKILHIKHSISLINQNFILQQTEIFDQTTNHNYCFFAQIIALLVFSQIGLPCRRLNITLCCFNPMHRQIFYGPYILIRLLQTISPLLDEHSHKKDSFLPTS